jgi:hypothetical protein
MAESINRKQMEQIARRMGYTGPMSKFGEFLMSSPKRKYADGGLVQDPNDIPLAPVGKAGGGIDATATAGVTTAASTHHIPAMPNMSDFEGTFGETPNVQVETLKAKDNQFIDPNSGQIQGAIPKTPVATVGNVKTVNTPTGVKTATYNPSLIGNDVEGVIDQFQHASGAVADESTVRGQLASLMQDFEGGNTPAWAAGALREANANMNARGLGASSMAGAATTQAAMEAALPIAMQDANANLQMQFLNLQNEQQKFMLGNEARLNAMFTDAAAENAAKQFNATSINQTRQFNASLKSSVKMFNAEQVNAMKQFNAGQKNAMTQFRASLKQDRQKFNAANQLIVDQANAQWRQEIATINNANINEANRVEAQLAANKTLSEMNAYFQERRDVLQYAFTAGENDKSRATQLLLQQLSIEEMERQDKSNSKSDFWKTIGAFAAEFIR